MGAVTEVTSELQFERAIGAASRVTVVDFYATWCGPCKVVAPMFDSLAARHEKQANFLRVDVDQHQSISGKWGVSAMPTFGFFRGGQKIDEVVGADIASVERKLKQHMGSAGGGAASGTGYVLGSGRKVTTTAGNGGSFGGIASASSDQTLYNGVVLAFVCWVVYQWWFGPQ